MKYILVFFLLWSLSPAYGFWPSVSDLYRPQDNMNLFESTREKTNFHAYSFASHKSWQSGVSGKYQFGKIQGLTEYIRLNQYSVDSHMAKLGLGYGSHEFKDVGQLWLGPLYEFGNVKQFGHYIQMRAQSMQPGWINETNISYYKLYKMSEKFQVAYYQGYFFDSKRQFRVLLGLDYIKTKKEPITLYTDFHPPIYKGVYMYEAGSFNVRNLNKIKLGGFDLKFGWNLPLISIKTEDDVSSIKKKKRFLFFNKQATYEKSEPFRKLLINPLMVFLDLEYQF